MINFFVFKCYNFQDFSSQIDSSISSGFHSAENAAKNAIIVMYNHSWPLIVKDFLILFFIAIILFIVGKNLENVVFLEHKELYL